MSKAQSGHSQNMAKMDRLLHIVAGYGTGYQPAHSELALESLRDLYDHAGRIVQQVTEAKARYTSAVNDREDLAGRLNSVFSKAVSAYEASGATAANLKDVKAIRRRFSGNAKTKATAPADPAAADPAKRSVAATHRDFQSRLDRLAELIEAVAGDPVYHPHEADITVAGLRSLLQQLTDARDKVMTATTDLGNARLDRNDALYAPETGMCPVANRVKRYVKSVYGPSSEQYRQLSPVTMSIPKAK